ncbi:MAG TPA: SDR family oxidoreductase [Solirubrobacteraceae bacterium]|nr:SDR family oxidoreductase [Solirubrobacteraceae bacterium]
MRALVTGGGGFIGSHLVDELLYCGHEVRVFDNFSTGDRRNLLHVAGDIDIVEGDLRSFERALTAVRDCEVVFHVAALPSVPRSVQDPLTTSEVNVTGTLNVLLAARDCGVRRVVAASSSSVYGAIEVQQKSETLPTVPLSPYGVSKLAAEANCRAFWEVYGLETVTLRYFNVFGPRQNPVSEYAAAIPQFIAAALLGEQPTIYGDGKQSRDFTFVDNVVRANLLAAAAPDIGGETFNIAMGGTHSLLELCDAIGQLAGESLHPRHSDPRPGDVRMSLADITKARAMLGFEPGTDFSSGLAITYDAMVADETLLPRISEARRWAAAA